MENYEQKYKKAMSFLKDLRPHMSDYCKEKLDSFFPELKESEDERIRRKLIKALKECGFTHFNDEFTVQEALAWLEKQGEPIDKIVKRATTEKQRVLVTESNGVANIDWDTRSIQDVKLLLEYGLGYIKKLEKQSEQETLCDKCKKAHPSHSCQDITELGRCIVEHEQKPAEWSKEDEEILKGIIDDIQRRLEDDPIEQLADIYSKEISWLKSLKDRVQPQPKQEWSEEDEKMVESCLLFVNANRMHPLATKCIDWLKYLKPNHWKPSEKQMEALKEAVDEHFDIDGGALWHLYEDLKKLREE